ncbi:MAG TPA: DUF4265 domain-containing protein [Chloroflexia bacterium]|nr:DUF4265 domain-containing protein [Chloroflexia bacterium]
MGIKSFVHQNPIWRNKANFLIGAKCSDEDTADLEWEQLWCRQVSENRFEICCIPFFVYNLALGDEVTTYSYLDIPYMLDQVVKPSGHYTFRVWFNDSSDSVIRNKITSEISRLECLIEWSSEHLLAVDAASNEQAQELADYLIQMEQQGYLIHETGY